MTTLERGRLTPTRTWTVSNTEVLTATQVALGVDPRRPSHCMVKDGDLLEDGADITKT